MTWTTQYHLMNWQRPTLQREFGSDYKHPYRTGGETPITVYFRNTDEKVVARKQTIIRIIVH